MSTWLDILNTQTPTTTTTTVPSSPSQSRTIKASSTVASSLHGNSRTRRKTKYSNKQRSTTTGGNIGIFQLFRKKFNRLYNTIDYTELSQRDIEIGGGGGGGDGADGGETAAEYSETVIVAALTATASESNSISSSSSSSEEDLFVSRRQRRKVRRKMVRKAGGYSLRQYYHRYQQHQLEQQQQQQQQQPCFHHIPIAQQQQPQQQSKHYSNNNNNNIINNINTSTSNNNNMWMPYNNNSEFDDFYSYGNNMAAPQNNIAACSNNIGNPSKTYITPSDIPPPPPHPTQHASSGCCRKSLLPHQSINASRQRLRQCQCDHSIEIMPSDTLQHSNHIQPLAPPASLATLPLTPTPPPPPILTHGLPLSQQQQQHQRSTHDHMPFREPHAGLLHTSATSAATTTAATAGAYNSSHQQQQQQQQHHHHHHHPHHYHQQPQQQQPYQHRTPDELLQATAYNKANDSTTNRLKPQNGMSPRTTRILLGVIFAIIVLALLATALTFIIKGSAYPDEAPLKSGNGIHLNDVLSGKFQAKRFNASWSRGTNVIYKEYNDFLNAQGIVEYDVKTKKKNILLGDSQYYFTHEKSADGQLLLLAKNFRKNFRHSFAAEYDIYNLSSSQIQPLTIKGAQKHLNMAQWAPVGNGLIISFARNLYYKPTAFAEEITITDDDSPLVFNGIPDWVYEEEVLSSNTATWFNPNGTKIAFIRFDDSPTPIMAFPFYGDAGDITFQYPINRYIAYPKAGAPNPRVRLFTADLELAAKNLDFLREIPVPSALNTETDYIITVVGWLNNDNVFSIWMNRIQNVAYMQVFDGVKRYEIFNIESKNGWIDLFSAPFKNRDGSRVALILPQPQENDGNYRHLCTISTRGSNNKPEVLTKGKFVVYSILHWDNSNDIIFYSATTATNSEYLHVYAIKASVGQRPKCLTCKLQISGGIEQNYFSADFNSDRQVIISSLGPGIPTNAIYEWTYKNNEVSLSKLVEWEMNHQLREGLRDRSMPIHEIHTLPIASGFTAKVLLQLPPNMDRSGKTKYPMLVDVYGGPDSYAVINKWNLDWGTYLTSNQSVIYAKIDGRGSGLRGDKLLHSVYLKFGTVEVTDQIEVTKQLHAKFSYIDANRTGIWGWSYGGFAAAMALANDNSTAFHCAASIAPVTDWTYYDSIYTERYMSLPKLNELGYNNSRLSTRVERLRDKRFLLVHGTLDDNVHYQQSMILAKNLERHNILFKQISYPDEDHGLVNVRPHLYHSLDRFFGECFNNERMIHNK